MTRVEAFLFICRCLSADPPSNIGGDVVWERVIEVSSEFLVTVALYCALAEKQLLDSIPPDVRAYFKAIHDLNRARNQAIVEDLAELARLLNQIGVEPLALKGAGHLATGLYRDPAARLLYDIDLVVPQDQATAAWDCLLAAGYQAGSNVPFRWDVDNHWPGLRRKGCACELELHYRSPWPQLVNTAAMFADSQLLEFRGARLRSGSATGSMVGAIAHGYVRHAAREWWTVPLRDLYDSALLARQRAGEIDWPRVVGIFQAAGHADALRAHCSLLERLFGQTVPGAGRGTASEWLYWRLSRTGIRYPDLGPFLARNVHSLRDVFSHTERGRKFRKGLITPSAYSLRLANLRILLRRRPDPEAGCKE